MGYWHCGLPDFPVYWNGGFNLGNEIWVPFHFILQSIFNNTNMSLLHRSERVGLPMAEAMFLGKTVISTIGLEMLIL